MTLSAAMELGPLLGWIALLAVLFAQLEIQIEGARGWAADLPTWRLPKDSAWRWLCGGRELTGYHVYAFAFMAAAFHWPLAFAGAWSLPLEARALGSLALFWLLEDSLWFAFNPAFGLRRFTPRHAPWHPRWFLGVPVDYFALAAAAGGLFAYSVAAGTAPP